MSPPLQPVRNPGRCLNWLLLGAIFGVAAFAATAINSLGRQADASRHGQTLLAGLKEKANRLNALEWETLHKGKLGPELATSVAAARQEMQDQFRQLAALSFQLRQIEELAERYKDYLRVVDQEFQLLGAGEIRQAEELDETKVDPAFEELSETLTAAGEEFAGVASSSLRSVRRWTFAILLGAAAAASLLFWQFHESQRAAAVATTTERVLRVANEDLERRVQERTAELVALNKQIGVAARQAGMAEVANSVLHNVGNALTSVNVAALTILEALKQSRLDDLPKAAQLLQDHAHDLGAFLTLDEQGRYFPGFLQSLAVQWRKEHVGLVQDAADLNKHVLHIREIVQRQQAISGVAEFTENLLISEVVEQALALTAELVEGNRISVRREIPSGLVVVADRSKLAQILVNLLRNAAQAISDHGVSKGQIVLSTEQQGDGRVFIHVTDNGPGIDPENLTKIFSYGFTTKKAGHGFGLHGSALGAKEMGGELRAFSEGAGSGARFTIELPSAAKPATAKAA